MSNFKYSANINGVEENKKRFIQDLELRGYKLSDYDFQLQDTLCVNSSIGSTQLSNGCYRSGDSPRSRDYTFNIDTEQEYNTALAVLSMKDDELFYIGELVEILAAGGWGYESANNGCIGIILKVENSNYPCEYFPKKGSTQEITFKTLNPKEKDSYTDEAVAPNLAYNKPVFRKLTELEVIKFYKTQKINMQEKKLIGYKLIKPEYAEVVLELEGRSFIGSDVKNGQILHCDHTESVNKLKKVGVLDLWFEPVYEQIKPTFKQYSLESGFTVIVHKTGEVMTNDGAFTIKELDTKFGICFRSTKFNKWDMVVTEAKYKIGCQVVTSGDIIGINELYKELNK
jgi:hypothetical protein